MKPTNVRSVLRISAQSPQARNRPDFAPKCSNRSLVHKSPST